MSVIAISPRPHRPGRTDPVPPRATPTLTVTLDLGAGTLSPGLARLVELLGELAEAGVLHQEIRTAVRSGAEWAPGPASRVGPDVPDVVRILAGSRMVRRGDQEIPLTRIEYDLLLFLAEHPRRVFTRRQLVASVWGYEHAVARTVDVHGRRLRAELGTDTPVVTTVYGVGYRLADEAPVVVDPER